MLPTPNSMHDAHITRQLRARINAMAHAYHALGYDVAYLWLHGLERDLDTLLAATSGFTIDLSPDFRPS